MHDKEHLSALPTDGSDPRFEPQEQEDFDAAVPRTHARLHPRLDENR